MILAGDIGGTNSRLGLFTVENGRLRPAGKTKIYPSKNYPSLEPILADFMAGRAPPGSGGRFGIPGPRVGNPGKTPEPPWALHGAPVSRLLWPGPGSLIEDPGG